MNSVSEFWSRFQVPLISHLELVFEEALLPRFCQFVRLLEIVSIEQFISSPHAQWMGRKQLDRQNIARAFLAKAVFNCSTTEMLIERLTVEPVLRRLCGFETVRSIPSSSTFSRAFKEFAEMNLGDRVHAALVATHVGKTVVTHVSRDSTEVGAREKPFNADKVRITSSSTSKELTLDMVEEPKEVVKEEVVAPAKRKPGRPKKGEVVPPKALTRLETQLTQTAHEALAELPKVCNWGSKNDSKGKSHRWVGWKAHFDWADKGLPLTVVTTSASCHDSQVAIPMMRLTASKCVSCYDLMDAAYDAASITQVSKELGHTPIIDKNVRRGEKIPKSDADAAIYKQRSTAERGNSRLKDEYGLRNLRVRGHAKAHMHIMFGVLALFSDQLHKIIMC